MGHTKKKNLVSMFPFLMLLAPTKLVSPLLLMLFLLNIKLFVLWDVFI